MLDQNLLPAFDTVARFELVEVAAISADPSYQRRISDRGKRVVNRIVRGFDWRRFGAISLSRDGDRLLVVDGQHRVEAARQLGLEAVPAIVFDADTRSQAETFLGMNMDRTSVGPADRYRARVTAMDPTACAARRIMDLHRVKLIEDAAGAYSAHTQGRRTRAISTLLRMVERHGEGLTGTAVELLCADEADVELTALAIRATTETVAALTDAGGDLNRLACVVAETDFDELAENAARLRKIVGGANHTHAAKLLARAYNKGLAEANRIPEGKT